MAYNNETAPRTTYHYNWKNTLNPSDSNYDWCDSQKDIHMEDGINVTEYTINRRGVVKNGKIVWKVK